MSNDPIAGFWGDSQHSSDDARPAAYTARKTYIYSCGKCGRGLKGGPGEGWPRYCDQGHKNVPET